MIVSLIAAMAENRVIGRNGTIPWDIPADRRRFRELTTGHHLVMGRKTFESIGRSLPGRLTIIVTRQPGYRAEGCVVVHDLAAALDLCRGDDEVFVAGGGEIYRAALPHADRIYLTIVGMNVAGETTFPELPVREFTEIAREEVAVDPPCVFIHFERLHGQGQGEAVREK